MGDRNPQVDLYIEKAADFAKPILNRFRDLVHKAWPQVEEEMKWSFPHFVYKGTMCSMAAFKSHCAIGFWKASLILGAAANRDAMGHLGRITSVADLPSEKVLTEYIKKAGELNEQGIKIARPPKKKSQEPIKVPEDLKKALSKNRKAGKTFDDFSPSHKREYIEWITEAKTAATREKRLATAVDWMAEGKIRNWKYVKA